MILISRELYSVSFARLIFYALVKYGIFTQEHPGVLGVLQEPKRHPGQPLDEPSQVVEQLRPDVVAESAEYGRKDERRQVGDAKHEAVLQKILIG